MRKKTKPNKLIYNKKTKHFPTNHKPDATVCHLYQITLCLLQMPCGALFNDSTTSTKE